MALNGVALRWRLQNLRAREGEECERERERKISIQKHWLNFTFGFMSPPYAW